jgi:D-glycero-D-manno-heptose 1,7-bisphosphate phosphatase
MRAVFLDRDGTLNEEMGYVNHVSRFHLLPGAAEAVRLLNENDWKVVVVSNQSGVARGYFPESVLAEVDARLNAELAREEARLDGTYYCLHHPQAQLEAYRRSCECRKPRPGLLRRAAQELGIDLGESWLIGDRLLDVETAHNAGARAVLVLTGYGRGERDWVLSASPVKPDHVAEDVLAAVRWLLGRP